MRSARWARAASTTPTPDDDDDWDDEDSSEIDDDSRTYKNPRNSPSTLCPRDEEQASLLVSDARNGGVEAIGGRLAAAALIFNGPSGQAAAVGHVTVYRESKGVTDRGLLTTFECQSGQSCRL